MRYTEFQYGRQHLDATGYQLSLTEDNFKVCCDVDSVSRRELTNNEITIDQFPRLPLKVSDNFKGSTDITAEEQTSLQDITVTVDELKKNRTGHQRTVKL